MGRRRQSGTVGIVLPQPDDGAGPEPRTHHHATRERRFSASHAVDSAIKVLPGMCTCNSSCISRERVKLALRIDTVRPAHNKLPRLEIVGAALRGLVFHEPLALAVQTTAAFQQIGRCAAVPPIFVGLSIELGCRLRQAKLACLTYCRHLAVVESSEMGRCGSLRPPFDSCQSLLGTRHPPTGRHQSSKREERFRVRSCIKAAVYLSISSKTGRVPGVELDKSLPRHTYFVHMSVSSIPST